MTAALAGMDSDVEWAGNGCDHGRRNEDARTRGARASGRPGRLDPILQGRAAAVRVRNSHVCNSHVCVNELSPMGNLDH